MHQIYSVKLNGVIRAIILDYYSVLLPDLYNIFAHEMSKVSEKLGQDIRAIFNDYYLGNLDFDGLLLSIEGMFRSKDMSTFFLNQYKNNIPTQLLDFARNMHQHFLKVAVVGNMGEREIGLITRFDSASKSLDLIAGPSTYGSNLLSEKFFVQALNTIGEPPESCILVSRHADYLEFVKKIGLKTYMYDNFSSLSDYLVEAIKAS